MIRMTGTVLVVGSVPLPSAEMVFRTCTRELGPYVFAYPDGEVGNRRYWTFYLASTTYANHPDLESVDVPASGLVMKPGRGTTEDEINRTWWRFQLGKGVETPVFDDLHYAEVASESYAVFTQLRDEQVIPAEARFQVSLPATGSAIMPFFARSTEWPVLYDAYRLAMRREVQRIVDAIPPRDLVIQWDIATEVRDILAGSSLLFPWAPRVAIDEKWRWHLRDFEELSANLPEEACLGYHFCFGTWGGWPHSTAADMSVCVRFANEAVARAGRRVDYLHMPVMPDAGEAFFAPLQQLRVGETRAYLGIVLGDGAEAFQRRAIEARRYIPKFGIASYCGWGREDSTRLPSLLTDLRECAERFSTMDMAA
jgi:hypothetical protein